MKKIVFLDLEDTVLDDFSKGFEAKAVNHAQVARFLAAERPDEVRIFSFAISNDWDVKTFERVYKSWLEKALGVTIQGGELVFKTQQLYELCLETGHYFETEQECRAFHRKDLGFLQFIRKSDEFVDCEVVLVDDAIGEPMTITLPKRNVAIRLINVETLQ